MNNMKHKWKKVFAGALVAVLGLTWQGTGLLAHAQTTSSLNASSVLTPDMATNDFERELLLLIQELRKDLVAQKIAKQIDEEDSDKAGDNFGDNAIIDGEKEDSEIQKEIDDEVDLESPESDEGDSRFDDMESLEDSAFSSSSDNGLSDDNGKAEKDGSGDGSQNGSDN
ncbi:MAG: hypothetical protein AAB920_01590 [Patescibacteria group bacterium]